MVSEKTAPPAFRASGLVFEGAKAFYAERVPGGANAYAASLPSELAEFWGQIFLATGRYDALPIVALSVHAAGLCGLSPAELVTENARWQAQRDVNGVYRALLKVLTPGMVAERLPKVAMRYFDFGEATAKLVAPSVCRSRQTHLPVPMIDWFAAASAGFCDMALRIAGARDVRVREVDRGGDGSRAGVPTATLTLEISWAP